MKSKLLLVGLCAISILSFEGASENSEWEDQSWRSWYARMVNCKNSKGGDCDFDELHSEVEEAAAAGEVNSTHNRYHYGNYHDVELREKCTALYAAAVNGDIVLVEALLKNGADTEKGSLRTGETPLMAAFAADKIGVARELLDHGANPNAQDDDGVTALSDEVRFFGGPEEVQMLCDAGADPLVVNSDGETAFDSWRRAMRVLNINPKKEDIEKHRKVWNIIHAALPWYKKPFYRRPW